MVEGQPEPVEVPGDVWVARFVEAMRREDPDSLGSELGRMKLLVDNLASDGLAVLSDESREQVAWVYADTAALLLDLMARRIAPSEDTLELIKEYHEARETQE